MTAPLVWLLLSALAVIAPPPSGPTPWQGHPPVVVTRPSQPTSGQTITVVVGQLPAAARHVVVVAEAQRAPAKRVTAQFHRATLVAPSPGPLSISIRFTVRGHRYSVQGGVVFVVPSNSSG
jgi:hypothetical protein